MEKNDEELCNAGHVMRPTTVGTKNNETITGYWCTVCKERYEVEWINVNEEKEKEVAEKQLRKDTLL